MPRLQARLPAPYQGHHLIFILTLFLTSAVIDYVCVCFV